MLTWVILLIFAIWAGLGAKYTYDLNKHFTKKYGLKGFFHRKRLKNYDEEDNTKMDLHFKRMILLFVSTFTLIFLTFFINAIIT